MRDATLFARQWAGLVAQARLLGEHIPGAEAIDHDGMVAGVIPSAPSSSVLNSAMSVDPERPPEQLGELARRYADAGATKWGLWVDGDDPAAAAAATAQGMVLDSRPAPMVARLADITPETARAPTHATDLATVGRVNDRAYGYDPPKLAPAIARLPKGERSLRVYAADHDHETAAVAIVHDIGDDTAMWFVATLPHAQGNGLATSILAQALHDARERGQRTASLQASPRGKPLYERLGFETVGTLHLYEQRLQRG
jgi:ribosomal protein S18 acetylase RimI-like enzyme